MIEWLNGWLSGTGFLVGWVLVSVGVITFMFDGRTKRYPPQRLPKSLHILGGAVFLAGTLFMGSAAMARIEGVCVAIEDGGKGGDRVWVETPAGQRDITTHHHACQLGQHVLKPAFTLSYSCGDHTGVRTVPGDVLLYVWMGFSTLLLCASLLSLGRRWRHRRS